MNQKVGAKKVNVEIVDRSEFIAVMKEELRINPKTTAVVAVDMLQRHLDPEIAPMLVPEHERVFANTKKLLEIVRQYQIPVIHVIFQLRPIEKQRRYNPFSGPAQLVNERLKPEERSWTGKP